MCTGTRLQYEYTSEGPNNQYLTYVRESNRVCIRKSSMKYEYKKDRVIFFTLTGSIDMSRLGEKIR
jgi:hypothetical protein